MAMWLTLVQNLLTPYLNISSSSGKSCSDFASEWLLDILQRFVRCNWVTKDRKRAFLYTFSLEQMFFFFGGGGGEFALLFLKAARLLYAVFLLLCRKWYLLWLSFPSENDKAHLWHIPLAFIYICLKKLLTKLYSYHSCNSYNLFWSDYTRRSIIHPRIRSWFAKGFFSEFFVV